MIDKFKASYSLKPILPINWTDYRFIRLEALKTEPDMFGSSYERESAYTQSDWISLLQDKSRAIFGLYKKDCIVGLTAVGIRKQSPLEAIFYATYLNSEHRGKGLAELFFPARIEWARRQGCQTLSVSHRAGNKASQSTILRFGFKYSHSEEANWPDGISAAELFYNLQLNS